MSSDSEKFSKLIRLLAGGGTKAFRKFLTKYSAPLSISDYIYKNQAEVFKLKLNESQRKLIVNREIIKMDISLLFKLSVHLFKDKMTAKERDCIYGIDFERNEFLHSDMLETAKAEITVFRQKWQKISLILLDLADEIGDPTFMSEMKEFITNTEKSSPDFAEILKTLFIWTQSSKALEEKVENLSSRFEQLKGTVMLF